jgi:hypothetical protein
MTAPIEPIPEPAHFKGKDAIGHVAQAQAKGIIASSEVHGTEIPGSISSGTDAARETVVLLTFLAIFLHQFLFSPYQIFKILALFSMSWLVWKAGRSAWLGWARLERLHRILAEEKWEIEHNRTQERSELKVLYAAKGFEGKLLEDVLDVLMADEDRLLKVMVEEELGLSLEVHEHPLKQSVGAGMGVLLSALFVLLSYRFWSLEGLYVSGLVVLGISAGVSAFFEKNRLIPAIIWNMGLLILVASFFIGLLNFFIQKGWL